MATVTCLSLDCGTDLMTSHLVCPACGSPRPSASVLAGGPKPSSSGDPAPVDDAESPHVRGADIRARVPMSDVCDHRDAGPGAIICPTCGDPISAVTRSPDPETRRFRIVAPWGVFPLVGSETEIGREVGPVADELKSHMTVSRRHGSFRIMGSGRLYVVDHGSSNGTFRNGNRIAPHVPVEIRSGDTVSFSSKVYFTVRAEPDRQ